MIKKYRNRNDLNLKQIELKLEGKMNTLLSGEVQDKFDIYTDSFDRKLRKLYQKLEKMSEKIAASQPKNQIIST